MAYQRRRKCAKEGNKNDATSEEEISTSTLSASASSHYLWPFSIYCASHVLTFDKNYWNSGTFAPASITIDIGTMPVYVTRVALLTVMEPKTGKVRHQIRVGSTLEDMHSVCWYNGVIGDDEWMQVQLSDGNNNNPRRKSRFVQILTHESPSFVAWRRIRLWKANV